MSGISRTSSTSTIELMAKAHFSCEHQKLSWGDLADDDRQLLVNRMVQAVHQLPDVIVFRLPPHGHMRQGLEEARASLLSEHRTLRSEISKPQGAPIDA